MTVPKTLKFLKKNNGSQREQIYCRRYNKLYSRCPVEDDLHSCECLSQCEMASKANGARPENGRYAKSA
jgi:hypothetical protein